MSPDSLRRSLAPVVLATANAFVLLCFGGASSAAAAQQPDSEVSATVAAPACADCIRAPQYLRGTESPSLADTGRRRAIEYSDAYATRLKIHQIGSYIELPLFAAEYVLGHKLITEENAGTLPRGSSLRGAHSAVAGGLGVLFAVNTVTGVWNLIESRHDPAGATRRWIHSILMLAADGGFVVTAAVAGQARRTTSGADTHRNIAIASMSLATASTLMMWLWRK